MGLQRATAVVSPKSQGPTLPTANSTFSPEHQPNGQSDASPPSAPSGGQDVGGPAQHASAGPGVAYAIIAASPATGNGVSTVSEAVKVTSRIKLYLNVSKEQTLLMTRLLTGDHHPATGPQHRRLPRGPGRGPAHTQVPQERGGSRGDPLLFIIIIIRRRYVIIITFFFFSSTENRLHGRSGPRHHRTPGGSVYLNH